MSRQEQKYRQNKIKKIITQSYSLCPRSKPEQPQGKQYPTSSSIRAQICIYDRRNNTHQSKNHCISSSCLNPTKLEPNLACRVRICTCDRRGNVLFLRKYGKVQFCICWQNFDFDCYRVMKFLKSFEVSQCYCSGIEERVYSLISIFQILQLTFIRIVKPLKFETKLIEFLPQIHQLPLHSRNQRDMQSYMQKQIQTLVALLEYYRFTTTRVYRQEDDYKNLTNIKTMVFENYCSAERRQRCPECFQDDQQQAIFVDFKF